jgi:hypothetical protein
MLKLRTATTKKFSWMFMRRARPFGLFSPSFRLRASLFERRLKTLALFCATAKKKARSLRKMTGIDSDQPGVSQILCKRRFSQKARYEKFTYGTDRGDEFHSVQPIMRPLNIYI